LREPEPCWTKKRRIRMPKGLVVYDSKTGRTEKMAIAISQGMKKAGLDTEAKKAENTSLTDLTDADAIVLGSPVYFSTVSTKMKELIDRSIALVPGKLKGKVGAAFASCDEACEMTLITLIAAMLWHEMIIVGRQSGGLGAISIGKPDDKCIAQCEAFGERIADITKAIAKG